MEAEVRNILVGMKAELSKGWIQGNLGVGQDEGEGVCFYGSIIKTSGIQGRECLNDFSGVPGRKGNTGFIITYDLSENPATYQVTKLLADELNLGINDLALWNDAPERTQQDIVDVIDRVLLKDKQNAEGNTRLLRLDPQSKYEELEESRTS